MNRYYRPWVDQYNVLKSSVHDKRRADVNILSITQFMQNLWDQEQLASRGTKKQASAHRE